MLSSIALWHDSLALWENPTTIEFLWLQPPIMSRRSERLLVITSHTPRTIPIPHMHAICRPLRAAAWTAQYGKDRYPYTPTATLATARKMPQVRSMLVRARRGPHRLGRKAATQVLTMHVTTPSVAICPLFPSLWVGWTTTYSMVASGPMTEHDQLLALFAAGVALRTVLSRSLLSRLASVVGAMTHDCPSILPRGYL